MLSSSIHYRTTLPQAQRSTAAKQVQQYVPIRVRQRKQADREHLLYCSTASKVHHSSIPQKASKQVQHYVPIRVRPQANRVGESQHMPSSIYTARRVLKRNEEIEVCPAYKNIQLYTSSHSAGVRPMLMQTRCCTVLFPNYSNKKSAILVPPLREKRGEICVFNILLVRAAARGRQFVFSR